MASPLPLLEPELTEPELYVLSELAPEPVLDVAELVVVSDVALESGDAVLACATAATPTVAAAAVTARAEVSTIVRRRAD